MVRAIFIVPAFISAIAYFSAPDAATAQGNCRLCDDPEPIDDQAELSRPLSITIQTNLNFDRIALMDSQGGQAEIDPRTGQRRLNDLVDLGGMAMLGSAIVEGEPGRAVRIELPSEVMLSAPGGRRAELRDLQSDLPAQPRIGSDGFLRFSFGGRLDLDGTDVGSFRGRVIINAEYE